MKSENAGDAATPFERVTQIFMYSFIESFK